MVLDSEFAVPVGQEKALVGIGANAPVYATVCGNCGYLRFFSKLVIDAILRHEGKISGEDKD